PAAQPEYPRYLVSAATERSYYGTPRPRGLRQGRLRSIVRAGHRRTWPEVLSQPHRNHADRGPGTRRAFFDQFPCGTRDGARGAQSCDRVPVGLAPPRAAASIPAIASLAVARGLSQSALVTGSRRYSSIPYDGSNRVRFL